MRYINLPNLSISLVCGERLIPECVYRPWNCFSFLGKQVTNHDAAYVEPWFFLLSPICVVSLSFNNLSWTTIPIPPPPPPSIPPGPHGGSSGGPHGAGGPGPSEGGPGPPRRRQWPLGGTIHFSRYYGFQDFFGFSLLCLFA